METVGGLAMVFLMSFLCAGYLKTFQVPHKDSVEGIDPQLVV